MSRGSTTPGDSDRSSQDKRSVMTVPPSNGNPDVVKSVLRTNLVKGVGLLLIGVSTLISAILIWHLMGTNDDLRQEVECRFDISSEVQTIGDNIDALTAEIFVAAIEENDPLVQELGQQLSLEIRKLNPAIERRASAIETCGR
jgi:hypothetical protein